MTGAASFRKVLLMPSAQQKIRQEFATADSPQYDGVAERQIAIIEAAGLAARIQAAAKYLNKFFPRGERVCGPNKLIGLVTHYIARQLQLTPDINPPMRCGLVHPHLAARFPS